MKMNLDDPNLTAYALGELSGPARAEMEEAVAQSAEARAFVQEARQIATLLETEFAAELNHATHKRLNIMPPLTTRSFWSDAPWMSIGVSALLAVSAIVAAVALSPRLQNRTSAAANSPAAVPPLPDLQIEVEAEPPSPSPAPMLALNIFQAPPELLKGSTVENQHKFASTSAPEQGRRIVSGMDITSTYRGSAGDRLASLAPEVSLRYQPEKTLALSASDNRASIRMSPPERRFAESESYTAGIRLKIQPKAPSPPVLSGSARGGIGTNGLSKADAQTDEFNSAEYNHFEENPFLPAITNPLSTFSIDVDTASYANVRRMIDAGTKPPKDAVRVEEMINYFSYDYPQPDGKEPFSINLEVAGCPWQSDHRLVRIGLKGREIAADKRGASNLVFLLDVSGSMEPSNRLPLVKQAMRLLVDRLTENDRVAIVVYAGGSGLVLPSTTGDRKEEILRALEELSAGGSTNGAAGINLAYHIAAEHFIKGGVNRVILATDGDFNVGVTSQGDLVRLAEEKAKGGVFLSVLGVGDDNFKDSTMQKLADRANGNYAYLDSLDEARKMLVQQMNGTLVTIAKDVKVQVEFNPLKIASYRLIGYEKRLLRKEDFNNDKVDAGEIGAGHTVTALYEVVPRGEANDPAASVPPVDPLKYAGPDPRAASTYPSPDLLTVKLRYKQPDGDKSELIERSLVDNEVDFSKASPDFRFAAAVAEFGMILRGSPHRGNATLAAVLARAQEAKGRDAPGYRAGFIELARKAQALAF